jgi:hypothetical protein
VKDRLVSPSHDVVTVVETYTTSYHILTILATLQHPISNRGAAAHST